MNKRNNRKTMACENALKEKGVKTIMAGGKRWIYGLIIKSPSALITTPKVFFLKFFYGMISIISTN